MSASSLYHPPQRLKGDLTIWLVIAIEMATFALLFISYAWARANDTPNFRLDQNTVDSSKGLINTVLLIAGSWMVARAQIALKTMDTKVTAKWLLSAMCMGLAFLAFKLQEYTAKFDAGLGLDSSTFYTFYFLLTGFHFFHVLAACVFLFFVWWTVRRTTSSEDMEHALDTAAAFWHMVDLLWIVLFPLLYLMP